MARHLLHLYEAFLIKSSSHNGRSPRLDNKEFGHNRDLIRESGNGLRCGAVGGLGVAAERKTKLRVIGQNATA